MVFSDTSPLVKYTSPPATQLCGEELYFFDNFVRARAFFTVLAPQKVVILIHVLYFLSVGRFRTLENSACNDLPIPGTRGINVVKKGDTFSINATALPLYNGQQRCPPRTHDSRCSRAALVQRN